MTPDVTWHPLAKMFGRWFLRRMPAAIFRRYYGTGRLRDDIKIRLQSAKPVTVTVAKKLVAPRLEIEGEAFNLSPYLDTSVTAVLSFLSADAAGGGVFGEVHDWRGFDLPRGRVRPFSLTYWLNEYQFSVVSACLKGHFPIEVFVMLWVDSKVGIARPFKTFKIADPAVR
jgi:hypothetical protein